MYAVMQRKREAEWHKGKIVRPATPMRFVRLGPDLRARYTPSLRKASVFSDVRVARSFAADLGLPTSSVVIV
jgi:hypothetical protein